MDGTLQQVARVAGGLTFDQVAAGALLGVIVAGIVAWGNSLVTFWGLRRNVTVSKAEKRAFVDLRNPMLTPAAASTDLACMIVNVGKVAASDVDIVMRAQSGEEARAWFAAVGADENIPVTLRIAVATDQVIATISYDDGMGGSCQPRTLLQRQVGGPTDRRRG